MKWSVLWVLAALISGCASINLNLPERADRVVKKSERTEPAIPLVKNSEYDLLPTKAHRRDALVIVRRLRQSGFNNTPVDNTLSDRAFTRYVDALDPNRNFFLASDIRAFETYRYRLDDTFEFGDVNAGFNVFNLYHLRAIERLNGLIAQLEGGINDIDFEKDEFLEIDLYGEWPDTIEAARELWRKQLKYRILNKKIAGHDLEHIRKTLLENYKTHRAKVLQTSGDDVFDIYINAVTKAYDAHARYFMPRELQKGSVSSEQAGIGAILQTEGGYTGVTRSVPGGPSVGKLYAGDRIIAVTQEGGNRVEIAGWRLDDVDELIRGHKGTGVHLEVIPIGASEHDTIEITIVRDQIKLEDKRATKSIVEVGGNKLGVIKIPAFYTDFRAMQQGHDNYRSVTRDVKRLLDDLNKEHINGLVIDLRDNGGGALNEVNSLIGLFIKTGATLQVKDAKGKIDLLGDPDPGVMYTGPMVVLVNRISAGVSEIFAAAIQDYQRGVVVGNRTFGQGTLQTLAPVFGGKFKYTLARYYRITGESTYLAGVTPDIELLDFYGDLSVGGRASGTLLPLDKVEAVYFRKADSVDAYISTLRKRHRARADANPDYVFLKHEAVRLDKMREETRYTLNETAKRRETKQYEQGVLAAVNQRRQAQGLSLISDPGEAQQQIALLGVFALEESGNILRDLIELKSENRAGESLIAE